MVKPASDLRYAVARQFSRYAYQRLHVGRVADKLYHQNCIHLEFN